MRYKFLLIFTMVLTYYKSEAKNCAKGPEEKIQVTDFETAKSIISLNFNILNEYVSSSPSDNSFILMFPAMAKSRCCAICQHLYDEFLIAAVSFRSSQLNKSQLFFGSADFDEASEIYQMIYVFLYLKNLGQMAFAIPLALAAGFLYSRRYNMDYLYNRQILMGMALFFCFTMVSGQMWNQIREPSYKHRTTNEPGYIKSGTYGQFIMENGYLVASLRVSFFMYMSCCLWYVITTVYVIIFHDTLN